MSTLIATIGASPLYPPAAYVSASSAGVEVTAGRPAATLTADQAREYADALRRAADVADGMRPRFCASCHAKIPPEPPTPNREHTP